MLDHHYQKRNDNNKRNNHYPHHVQHHPHVYHPYQHPVQYEFPHFRLSDEAMFLCMFMKIHLLLKSEIMAMLIKRLESDLSEFNVCLKLDIDLQRNCESRTSFLSLILNNFHLI